MTQDVISRNEAPTEAPFIFDKATGEITGYTDNMAKVVIPETIEGVEVRSIGNKAFARKGLVSVVIPSTVKVIKERAFSWNQLHHLELSEGLEVIESAAFAYNDIGILHLPDSVNFVGEECFNKNSFEKISMAAPKFEGNPFGELELVKIDFRDPIYSFAKDRRTLVKNESDSMTAITVSGGQVPEGVHKLASRSVYSSRGPEMRFPSTLKFIEDYAFDFVKIDRLIIPSDIEYIGPNAFEDVSCDQGLTLVAPKGSYVEKFAADYGFKFEVLEGGGGNILKSATSGLLQKIRTSSIFGK